MTTKRNHYVPEWYQKRFLKEGQNTFFVNTVQKNIKLPNGTEKAITPKIKIKGPDKIFYGIDLYNIFFKGIRIDEIEKFFFGSIDRKGKSGLIDYVNNDISGMHHSFSDFLEYISIQKIRTPLGLSLLKEKFHPKMSYAQLLIEMQFIKHIYCTIFAESVREVVSAKNSNIKFLLSDNPVAIYNPQILPEDKIFRTCSLHSIGTQILFPLDLNHCLIFTHLEYAKNPNIADTLKTKTNARNMDTPLIYLEANIRKRELSDNEVLIINNIIKKNSEKHYAASEREWLFPEKTISKKWHEYTDVLLPKDELYKFDGETFIGYKDGSVEYRDNLGHHRKMDHLKIKNSNTGHERYFDIQERNLIFINACNDILDLNKGKDWNFVRKNITNDQVIKIFKFFSSLFPRSCNILELLPTKEKNISRILYSGSINLKIVQTKIIELTKYFDEVFLINDFPNPEYLNKKYNPIENPEMFKSELIKNLSILFFLKPYIANKNIHFIPNPMIYDFNLRKYCIKMFEQRLKNKNYLPKTLQIDITEASINSAFMFSDETARRFISENINLENKDLDSIFTKLKNDYLEDPSTLLQKTSNQLQFHIYEPNLEMSFFIAQIIDSLLIFSDIERIEEFKDSTKKTTEHIIEYSIKMPFEKKLFYSNTDVNNKYKTTKETIFALYKSIKNDTSEINRIGIFNNAMACINNFNNSFTSTLKTNEFFTENINFYIGKSENFYLWQSLRLLACFSCNEYEKDVPLILSYC